MADDPLASPKSLADGRFELRELLGAGGMARVYRAWDTKLGVERAIKLLRTDGRASKVRERRLGIEARAMSRVRHPHILAVHDIGESPAGAYVVMDYVPGGTVDDQMLASGGIPPRQAVAWMLEVLSALEAAHAVHVIHRDVKPSNILLDARGRALLADFGIAMLADETDRMTRTNITMGSVSYMAPEQRLDAREVDATADVYAAACSLFHMLTNATPVDLFTAAEGSPRWEDVPLALRPALYRATRLDPRERFQTAGAFADALRDALPRLDEVAAPVRAASVTVEPTVLIDPGGPSRLSTLGGEPTLDEARWVPWIGGLLSAAALALLVAWGVTGPRVQASPGDTAREAAPLASVEAPPPLPPQAPEVTPAPSVATERAEAAPPSAPAPRPRIAQAVSPAARRPLADVVEGVRDVAPVLGAAAVAAPSPADAPSITRVAGTWQGTLAGYAVRVDLVGSDARVSGEARSTAGGAERVVPFVGRLDAAAATLVLEDVGEGPDVGRWVLGVEGDGTRLVGSFHRRDGRGTVRVSLKRVD